MGCLLYTSETKIEASSYMDFSDNLLFVISEWERGSAIRLLTRNGHGFEQQDSVEIPGGQLCHITYLPRQHVLLGACYGSGDVFSVAVDPSMASFGKLLTYQKQGRGEECSVCLLYTSCNGGRVYPAQNPQGDSGNL